MTFTDIIYDASDGVATITINRNAGLGAFAVDYTTTSATAKAGVEAGCPDLEPSDVLCDCEVQVEQITRKIVSFGVFEVIVPKKGSIYRPSNCALVPEVVKESRKTVET